MNEASLKPVIDELETLFSKFNKAFFEGKLEKPVITVSPDHTRGAYGWCTAWKAWQDGTKEGGYYEINLCAEYLNRPFEETCGTLLHEMVHLQNLQDNVQDTSRSGSYHNRKFKETAEAHGLTVEKGEKYGWHKTALNPQAEAFVKSLGKSGFCLVRPRTNPLKGSRKGGDQVPASMFAPVAEPSSGPPRKFMFSVENVKWPLKNKSDNPIKLFERSMHNDHFCRASEERYGTDQCEPI